MVGDERKQHYLVPEVGEVALLAIGAPFVLGRHSDSDLVVRARDVSRRHAEIDWVGDPVRPVVRALGRHGTLLNGDPLEPDQDRPLHNGDRLRLGDEFGVCYLFATSDGVKRFVLEREQELTREHRTSKQGPDTRAIRLAQGELAKFTERERQVARLAITGLSNSEISHELKISVSTVKLHLRNAYAKTGTQGRTELTAFLLGGETPRWQE